MIEVKPETRKKMKTLKTTLLLFALSLFSLNLAEAQIMEVSFENHGRSFDLKQWLSSSFGQNTYTDFEAEIDEPVILYTYRISNADLVYEQALDTEEWMTAPFECDKFENDLEVEQWMTLPFSREMEEEPEVEEWMTSSWV